MFVGGGGFGCETDSVRRLFERTIRTTSADLTLHVIIVYPDFFLQTKSCAVVGYRMLRNIDLFKRYDM